VGPPQTRKPSIFLRAVGVGGKRATIEVERSAPNARVRAMSPSAATGVSWIRARGRAGGRSGRTSVACNTIPDLRLSEREAKLAVRREPRARERGLRCAAPHCGRQCGMCAHGLLPSDGREGLRAARGAGHAAGVSAYAEERGLGMPRRASARVACVTMPAAASGAQCGRSAAMRRPRLRHRRVVRAELV
jgi:hypothetical protein